MNCSLAAFAELNSFLLHVRIHQIAGYSFTSLKLSKANLNFRPHFFLLSLSQMIVVIEFPGKVSSGCIVAIKILHNRSFYTPIGCHAVLYSTVSRIQ